MDVQLRASSAVVNELLSRYIERRLQFAIGRFSPRVGHVLVRLDGTGKGLSSRCQISAEVHPVGRIAVEVEDPDLFAAMDRAAGRMGRRVEREVERLRELRTGRESIRMIA